MFQIFSRWEFYYSTSSEKEKKKKKRERENVQTPNASAIKRQKFIWKRIIIAAGVRWAKTTWKKHRPVTIHWGDGARGSCVCVYLVCSYLVRAFGARLTFGDATDSVTFVIASPHIPLSLCLSTHSTIPNSNSYHARRLGLFGRIVDTQTFRTFIYIKKKKRKKNGKIFFVCSSIIVASLST